MEEFSESSPAYKKKDEKKASEKHKQLANFIKEIHSQLRDESEIYGLEEAWKMHISQNEKLTNYAESMYKLATEHWSQKSQNSVASAHCRIEWIKNQCKQYFFSTGIKKFDDKEKHLLEKNIQELDTNINIDIIKTDFKSKINILDVGSCYNPFATEDEFSVTAIDIAPYSSDVIKCDFLNLKVTNEKKFTENKEKLIELPKNSFEAVIFSLFLEYIPCPEQRYLCCKKAYDLLKDGGILFIITPDSKHQGANVRIINTSWKVILAKLGFMRIHYEKLQHIHCLMFRKCFYKEAAIKKINWEKIPQDDELYMSTKIFIPQDFHSRILKENDESKIEQLVHNDEELRTLFDELPSQV